MIPTTPWDSVWNGVAQWMGVRGDDDLDFVVPNRRNFDKCSLFTDEDLFVDFQFPHNTCNINDADGDGVPDENDQCPGTPYWADVGVDQFGCLMPTAAPLPTPAPTDFPTAAPTEDNGDRIYQSEHATLHDASIEGSASGFTGGG